MTDAHQRRLDKLDGEDVFIVDNTADFPKDSPGEKITKQIRPMMQEARTLDARLTAELGERRAAQEAKDSWRDKLLNLLRDYATGGKGLAGEIPGITAILKVPDNRNDQNLISAATAFFGATAPHTALFETVDLTADDHNNLITFRDAFIAAANEWESAVEQHAEAVGALDALFREMMSLSRKRSAIVKLKYRNNAGKLAAWTVASHLDRAPKPKPPTP